MKTIPDFLKAFTEGNFDVLEDIVENKYQKFMTAYWLLKDYQDNIKELKYKDTKKDELKIHITFKGVKPEEIRDKIKKVIKDEEISPMVTLRVSKKVLHITITRDEEEIL